MNLTRYLFSGVTILLTLSVIAQEREEFGEEGSTPIKHDELKTATENVVNAASEQCESWSRDDEVEETELATYMFDCINEQLAGMGYKPILIIRQ